MFALKVALRPWRITPLSQWLSASTLAVLLFVFSFLFWFSNSLGPIIGRLSSDQVVTVYLDGGEESSPAKLTDEIKLSLGSSAQSVDHVSTTGFIAELGRSYPDLAREVSSLGADMKMIAPEYITIRGLVSPNQIENMKRLKGVDSVDSSTERFRPIIESLTTTQWVTRVFMGAVLFGLFSVLFLMARLNASIHQEARELIHQLGGSRLQSQLPQVAHQTGLGILGGLVAAGLWSLSQTIMLHKVQTFSPFFKDLSPASPASSFLIVLIGASFGFLSGWIHLKAGERARI